MRLLGQLPLSRVSSILLLPACYIHFTLDYTITHAHLRLLDTRLALIRYITTNCQPRHDDL